MKILNKSYRRIITLHLDGQRHSSPYNNDDYCTGLSRNEYMRKTRFAFEWSAYILYIYTSLYRIYISYIYVYGLYRVRVHEYMYKDTRKESLSHSSLFKCAYTPSAVVYFSFKCHGREKSKYKNQG